MRRLAADDFDLALTLESGQVFTWTRSPEGWHYAAFGDALVKVRQDGAAIEYASSGEEPAPETVAQYFALSDNLPEIYSAIDTDPYLHEAIGALRGLRVMRQPSWECLAAFLMTSFNNIARVRLMIGRLQQTFGAPVALNGFAGHTFPTAAAVAASSERELRALGLGFRAPFLLGTARRVCDGWDLEALQRVPYDEAKARIQELPGVGDKVADCILLFACGHHEAFPVDVWIKRVVERVYFKGRRRTERQIRAFARRRFGRYAGYAQQYLFHYARTTWLRKSGRTSHVARRAKAVARRTSHVVRDPAPPIRHLRSSSASQSTTYDLRHATALQVSA